MNIAERFEATKGRFDIDLGVVHHFAAGLYAKRMDLPKGFEALSHAHTYDHLSILASGKVVVKTDKNPEGIEYVAPACLEIKAGLNHSILALEDVSWFCIHATNETDAEKIDEVLIEERF